MEHVEHLVGQLPLKEVLNVDLKAEEMVSPGPCCWVGRAAKCALRPAGHREVVRWVMGCRLSTSLLEHCTGLGWAER